MPPSREIEMKDFGLPLKEDASFGNGNTKSFNMREPAYGDEEGGRQSGTARRIDRWVDSFRRDPNLRITPYYDEVIDDGLDEGEEEDGGRRISMAARGYSGTPYYDMRMAAIQTAQSGLARKLKGRHLQMIAIGGSIGTGLFVASGRALEAGGPASLLIAYSFIGAGLYFTVQALGELSVAFPVAGSFSAYSTRFLHPSWGFAMGWK
jgi:yeast amino acid transporter